MAAGQKYVGNDHSAVFGIPLASLPDKALIPDLFVPRIVKECVEFLRKNALRCKGLFRMAGYVQKRNAFREKVSHGPFTSFGDSESDFRPDSTSDCHTVADLLKLYLRELPEPPVPVPVFDAYRRFLANEGGDAPTSVSFLARLADTALPPLNYNLLKYTCLFLNNVAIFHDENDMDSYNLAVIFAPNLLRLHDAPVSNSLNFTCDWKIEIGFVRTLIENADFIFCHPYLPPTRAHIKVVSTPSRPPINMSAPISGDWDEVFAPLKNFRETLPKKQYRPIRFISLNDEQKELLKEKSSCNSSGAPAVAKPGENTNACEFPYMSKPCFRDRKMSKSLDMISLSDGTLLDSLPSISTLSSETTVNTTSSHELTGHEDVHTMVTTISSRINMAESEVSKLTNDLALMTNRIGYI